MALKGNKAKDLVVLTAATTSEEICF